MANQQRGNPKTFTAGADLSAKQFYFVKMSSGNVVACGDGERAIGVLQDKPTASGKAAAVNTAEGDILKVVCGGTVTIDGDVASDADGAAVDATTGDIILGTAREAGAAGQLIEIVFKPTIAAA